MKQFIQINLILFALLTLALTSCKKDEVIDEMEVDGVSLEMDKETLLSELTNQSAIYFFDIHFMENTNNHLQNAPFTNATLSE